MSARSLSPLPSFPGRGSTSAGLLALALLFAAFPAAALEPDEVLVLARATDTEARPLFNYYRGLRNVPEGNIHGVLIPECETIGRKDFERWVMGPLRRDLARPERAKIRCLLCLRGLPIRVGAAEAADLDAKRRESTIASFDSEIALALAPPETLEGWAANPFFLPDPRLPSPVFAPGAARPLMVARLDGPTKEAPYRLIDKAIEGEARGLAGLFCFDARGIRGEGGYAFYDERIRQAAAVAQAAGLAVKLDDRQALFGRGDCPETAFYIGWYSLSNYVDAFTFAPGAIGFHVASGEAESLRRGNAWVKGLIEHGIAATLGPTDEPYLGSFPDPLAFLLHVIGGRETLAEIYWRTVPHASWRQVLIGDPLYRPHLPRRPL
jgi:uncharacterized protein (TIGR03790 family)